MVREGAGFLQCLQVIRCRPPVLMFDNGSGFQMGVGEQYSDPRKSERWVGTVDVEAVTRLSLSGKSHARKRSPAT